MGNISIHVREELKKKLDRLAKQTERSRSWLVTDAVESYLEHRAWMDTQIAEAVGKVETGRAQFLPHEEVMAYLRAKAGRR